MLNSLYSSYLQVLHSVLYARTEVLFGKLLYVWSWRMNGSSDCEMSSRLLTASMTNHSISLLDDTFECWEALIFFLQWRAWKVALKGHFESSAKRSVDSDSLASDWWKDHDRLIATVGQMKTSVLFCLFYFHYFALLSWIIILGLWTNAVAGWLSTFY